MQHNPSRTYVTKNAVLMDDEAHSLLTLQGVNVLVALEEALVLSILLSRAASKAAIPTALQAYDQVCRPRAEEAARHTIQYGLATIGRDEEIGLNPYLMAPRLHYHWQILKESKIEAQQTAAIRLMDQLLREC
jgi:salicylate hydroxylase